MKKALELPGIYQAFQEAGGFFGARVKAQSEFLDIRPGMQVIDIGCGPGHIAKFMPEGVDYVGFDIDRSYIDHANRRFGNRGRFFCQFFDAAAARQFGPADIVMMNGVLHHIGDDELGDTLRNVREALRPGGLLFTLDGCYRQGQSAFRRWMLDNDRGRFVRDEAGYRQVLAPVFETVELHIRENYSRVPYTFVVGVSARTT
ncbi:MAG: class I SAM-dependent methyltransferase [Rhizobiales bacterium]|nr:class I SAM-dependent methyltransferase [Hyphomicrobiales bacterium]